MRNMAPHERTHAVSRTVLSLVLLLAIFLLGAREAMAPLQIAAAQGMAVLASFHAGKGLSREVEDENRGSSNWSGEADILLSLRGRGGGPAAEQRYREFPYVGHNSWDSGYVTPEL